MRRKFWRCLSGIAAFITLLFPFTLYGQPGRVILLENADSLVGRVINGEKARELVGNVRFSQENVRVTCDRAIQYLESGKVDLLGNVVVRDDSITMHAPRGRYHKDARRAEAFDSVSLDDGNLLVTSQYAEYFVEPKRASFKTNVTVRDTGSVLIADSVVYFRPTRQSLAFGNVTVFNAADNVAISGQKFESDALTKFSRMTEQPVLVQFDTSMPGRIDTLIVRSKVMESYRDSVRKLVAIDSVQIVRSSLSAVGGRAVFFTEHDSINLRVKPMVWYHQSQVSGDSINVYLEQRRLHTVVVLGNAVAVSRSDTLRPDRFDQITGETLSMHFANQELDHITVDTRASSVYHLYDDTLANGLNKTSGDRLFMQFEEGRLSSIKVVGGVQGQYVPENLLKGKELEYTLAGVQWSADRPGARKDDFTRQRTGKPLPRSFRMIRQ